MRFSLQKHIAVIMFATLLVGCGDSNSKQPNSPPPPPPSSPALASISIGPIGPAIRVGGSIPLKATGTFTDGSTKDLSSSATWSSDNTNIATVRAGTVAGMALGVATITAASGSISDTTAVNVTELNLNESALQ